MTKEGKPARNASRAGFLARSRLMGARGLQASTIGFVLVGYITAGFLLGWWLDNRFGTQFWMPLLVIAGVIGGFREMFLTVAAINKEQQNQPRDEAAAPMAKPVKSTFQSTSSADATTTATETRVRPRLFAVPPPPRASFEAPPDVAREVVAREAEIEAEAEAEAEENEVDGDAARLLAALNEHPDDAEAKALIEKLLADDNDAPEARNSSHEK